MKKEQSSIIPLGLMAVGLFILWTSNMGKNGNTVDTLVMTGIAIYAIIGLSR